MNNYTHRQNNMSLSILNNTLNDYYTKTHKWTYIKEKFHKVPQLHLRI